MMIHSCNPRCWFAKREDCNCRCGGANHKIGLQEGVEEKMAEMTEVFKEYRQTRRKERKLKRKGAEDFDLGSHKLMDKIMKLGKKARVKKQK